MPDPRNLVYAFGGEVDAGEFSLDITSDELQPAEISALLGLQPTYQHSPGESFGERSLPFKFGRWKHTTARLDFRAVHCFEEQFDDFVRALPDNPTVWERIAAQYDANVVIRAWMHTWNREFDISPFALGELAR
ncbi:MAG TPA: DUF4279 domain-containing protein, partial [Candidatus Limnocylindria bacterium]|nr:DUF4279 domain-containing protein [Candidatus Limnocylindria bacterium]